MPASNPLRPKMVEIVPEGACGAARVEHFTVSEADSRFTALRPGEYVPAGRYARLHVGHTMFMSDTAMEWRTNLGAIHRAAGDVLIAGLGLGFVLPPILAKPAVRSVTVLEKHGDVIRLVEPPIRKHLGADAARLAIIETDAFKWRPATKYDCIYFDIWGGQSTDDLADMTKLKRRYARAVAPGGWMGCWREDSLRADKRREARCAW